MSKLVYFLVPLGILLSGITLINLQESDSVHDLKYMGDHLTVLQTSLPPSLNFCGEPVPMDRLEVKKRVEREVEKHLHYRANTRLLIRRANKYRPTILKVLREQGIPDDFFYLAVAESMLSNAVSSKGAKGFWQFMPATARHYQLEVSSGVDERFHLEKATRAACKYLKDSYKKYGNWSLVAASYNMGPSGLTRAIKRQQTDDFYQLKLNRETGNYLYRILGLKSVLSNPTRYGIKVNDLQFAHNAQPSTYRLVKVEENIDDLSEFAKEKGVSLQELKTWNPWLVANSLPVQGEKSYRLKVPVQDPRAQQPLVAAMSK